MLDGGKQVQPTLPSAQRSKYLCEIQLQLPPIEVCLVEFYSSPCCCLRLAEIYSDSSKAFEQLKCNLVIIDGEKRFESLLQSEGQHSRENEGGWEEEEFLKACGSTLRTFLYSSVSVSIRTCEQ